MDGDVRVLTTFQTTPGKTEKNWGIWEPPNIPTVAIKYHGPNAAKQEDFLGSGWCQFFIEDTWCMSKEIDWKSLLWKGKTCYKLGFREKLLEWFVSVGSHLVCWQLGYTKHIAHNTNSTSGNSKLQRPRSLNSNAQQPPKILKKQSLQSRTNSTCFPVFLFPPRPHYQVHIHIVPIPLASIR